MSGALCKVHNKQRLQNHRSAQARAVRVYRMHKPEHMEEPEGNSIAFISGEA